MGFNENLKQLLKDRQMKQADLCRMTGIQTSLMSDYLGGKKSPTIGNAILIADALNISLDTLVGKSTLTEEKEVPGVLAELYSAVQGLSVDEQLYLLDTIKALKRHLNGEQK